MKFVKFLGAPILKNIFKRLLLSVLRSKFILKENEVRLTITTTKKVIVGKVQYSNDKSICSILSIYF